MNNKEYKKLTSQIRQDFNNKIQPYYLGHTCEICNSNNNLELHHKVPLSIVVLNLLKSDIDTKFYREYAIGLQISNGFETLCRDCHRSHPDISKIHRRARKKLSARKPPQYNINYNELDKYINKTIFGVENRRGLIKAVNARDKQGRLLKSRVKLNDKLSKETNRMYYIEDKQSWRNKTYGQMYWLLTKKEDINKQQS